jgi:hypothetical protein
MEETMRVTRRGFDMLGVTFYWWEILAVGISGALFGAMLVDAIRHLVH